MAVSSAMSLRRWEFADTSRTPRLPAVSPRLSARGAKAMKDIGPLAESAKRSLTERTLEAAEAWSIPNTPVEHLSHPTRGLELSPESRSGFFGRLVGLDIEAELQRQALLLKGLLRDVAVIRDTVWHLADERSILSRAAQEAKEAHDVTDALRMSLNDLASEVQRQRSLWETEELSRAEHREEHSSGPGTKGIDVDLSLLETRYEEQSRDFEAGFEEHRRKLEERFQEHRGFMHQKLEEHSSKLEERFQEQYGFMSQRLEEHSHKFQESIQEHHGFMHQRLEQHSSKLEERFQEQCGFMHQLLDERKHNLEEQHGLVHSQLEEMQARVQDLHMMLHREAESRRGASRESIIQSISACLAEEVAQRACESVTPALERMAAEAAEAQRPSTSPAILGGGEGRTPSEVSHIGQEVAAEVASELIQLILTEWRATPTPEEV
ncbi:Uncharacterized protein SCF082_LOCUS4013 [Durusdinium trenchii]|uniref:Uncharacterized protein n=1 Tax=Durusdinium trenchii TaxID=1381693 RepID=A0ABP0HWQ3_9DINO